VFVLRKPLLLKELKALTLMMAIGFKTEPIILPIVVAYVLFIIADFCTILYRLEQRARGLRNYTDTKALVSCS
jgi:hypothetical protein